MKPIKKVLIANRGEISVRVAKTCKKMGIHCISLYTDIESNYPHVYEADQAVCLGSGSLQETYLNIKKIVSLAKDFNVDAVHPGYGFLSENSRFSQALEEVGIKLIGPNSFAMEAMGDKKRSKEVLESADIPLIPGYHGDEQSLKVLKEEALKIGFPILIKATAGGGGKGMRIVHSEAEFESHLESAKREAKNAFSNDKVLIEKFIENPRHIEVQVLSDQHKNHFHLFERECSIQRRYQKIIEETPSVALDNSLREKICQTAVRIASHINYEGAGTVEFILDDNKNFYFLEMNTRLQVEHPITEMITGLDLVELQIRVAQGDNLKEELQKISNKGHAIEARIYAENPDQSFLPTIGRIFKVGESLESGVRLDTGYLDGNEVGIDFDPMCAKLIVHDENRSCAIEKMKRALMSYPFLGLKTNREYLLRILKHPSFLSGMTYTHFVETHKESLSPKDLTDELSAKAIAAYLFSNQVKAGESLWSELASFRLNSKKPSQLRKYRVNQETVEFKVTLFKEKSLTLELNSKEFHFSLEGKNEMSSNGKVHQFWSLDDDVIVDGNDFKVMPFRGERVALEGGQSKLLSPMPGKILKVLVKENDLVEPGQALVVMEAMKMEHTISSFSKAKVEKVLCKEGELISGDVELVRLKEQ